MTTTVLRCNTFIKSSFFGYFFHRENPLKQFKSAILMFNLGIFTEFTVLTNSEDCQKPAV